MNEILNLLPVMQAAAPDMLFTLAPIGLVILVFYFLILRPQNKKQKELKQMLAALKKNDRVQTIGGIRGVIANNLKEGDTTVILKVDDNVKMEFSRFSIVTASKLSYPKIFSLPQNAFTNSDSSLISTVAYNDSAVAQKTSS